MTLKLKSIGKILDEKENPKQINFKLSRQEGLFIDQQIPKQQSKYQCYLPIIKKQEDKLKFKAEFLINQDPRKSRFAHSKLMAIEKISCLLTTLIFFLSCCKTEVDILAEKPNDIASMYIMHTLSICTLILIFIIVLRYICFFELQYAQNKIYLKKNHDQWMITTFFRKSDNLKYLLLEILIILPHPLTILNNTTYQLFQTFDQKFINHSYNDLLQLLGVFKIYIVIRSLINISAYSSPRASRLCYQNGFQHSTLYIVKCILHESPLKAISIIFMILVLIFGYSLKLCEGVLFLYNNGVKTGFQTYQNCYWCIFITMTTVGYGDYYPKTLPGRTIILVTAISGVLLSSLLIVSLSLYLQMIPSQSKSHITLMRLSEQAELSQQSSRALADTIKLHSLIAKNKQSSQGKDQNEINLNFQRLKENIDKVKNRTRTIKSTIDTDNIIQEMNRFFYILKDNLKDIFSGQIKLKQQISKIDEIHEIKLSFIKQVSQMLSKTCSKGAAMQKATINL